MSTPATRPQLTSYGLCPLSRVEFSSIVLAFALACLCKGKLWNCCTWTRQHNFGTRMERQNKLDWRPMSDAVGLLVGAPARENAKCEWMHRCRRFTATVIAVEQVGRRNGLSQTNTLGVLMTVRENFIIADRGNEKNCVYSHEVMTLRIQFCRKLFCASRSTKLNEYKFHFGSLTVAVVVFGIWLKLLSKEKLLHCLWGGQRSDGKFNYNLNEFGARTMTGRLWGRMGGKTNKWCALTSD